MQSSAGASLTFPSPFSFKRRLPASENDKIEHVKQGIMFHQPILFPTQGPSGDTNSYLCSAWPSREAGRRVQGVGGCPLSVHGHVKGSPQCPLCPGLDVPRGTALPCALSQGTQVGKGLGGAWGPSNPVCEDGGFPAPCPVWWPQQSPPGEQISPCPLLGPSEKGAGVHGWVLGCTGWVPPGAGRGEAGVREAGVGEPGSGGLSRKAPGAAIGFCLAVPSLSIQR